MQISAHTQSLKNDKRRPPVIRPPRRGGRGGTRRPGRRRRRTFVAKQQVAALVVAVGKLDGEAKLLLRCGRYTLIRHVVARLRRCIGTVIVATDPEQVEKTSSILGKDAEVIGAGPEYLHAVAQLFEQTQAPFLLVHDVSWPFASPKLIRDVALAGLETGAAAAVDYFNTPLGRLDGEGLVSIREEPGRYVMAQSPAVFARDVLATALQQARDKDLADLSVWELVQQSGVAISPVKNEPANIPIRTSLDWSIARGAVWPWVRQRMARNRSGKERKPGPGG